MGFDAGDDARLPTIAPYPTKNGFGATLSSANWQYTERFQ
jgi:hypothetical protein